MTENDKIINSFNSTFSFDQRLFAADIRCSIAYCDGLFQAGILTRLEAEKIKNGLSTLLKRADFDRNYFAGSDAPNIHSFIETKLIQIIGGTGEKLQTGRSRFEQTSTALRFWLREEIEEISKIAVNLQKSIIQTAEKQTRAVLPAYAHLRKTQPILWAHWCLAYFEMFARDRDRLDEVWRRTNILPLGSGFSAGTNYEIDREAIAAALNFEGVTLNSLDAISDFDFAVEFANACALLMLHLSGLAEDLILYSSDEFGFIELREANFSPFSENKYLNSLQFIRGKSSSIFGHQTALLATIKGLPIGFCNDFQEVARTIFACADTVKKCLQSAAIIFENLRINEEKTRQAVEKGFLNAAEFAEYLVQKGVPLRYAQDLTGKIVLHAISKKREFNELSLADFQQFSTVVETDVFEFLSLEETLARKNQIGGTAPERVFEALEEAKQSLENE